MLVLSRKKQEQIRIGDNITVTILRVKGKAVSLGIDAPRSIRVSRGELPPLENSQKPSLLSMQVESVSEVCSESSASDSSAVEKGAAEKGAAEKSGAGCSDADPMREIDACLARGPLWPVIGAADAPV